MNCKNLKCCFLSQVLTKFPGFSKTCVWLHKRRGSEDLDDGDFLLREAESSLASRWPMESSQPTTGKTHVHFLDSDAAPLVIARPEHEPHRGLLVQNFSSKSGG